MHRGQGRRAHLVSNVLPEVCGVPKPDLAQINTFILFGALRLCEDGVEDLDIRHSPRIHTWHSNTGVGHIMAALQCSNCYLQGINSCVWSLSLDADPSSASTRPTGGEHAGLTHSVPRHTHWNNPIRSVIKPCGGPEAHHSCQAGRNSA